MRSTKLRGDIGLPPFRCGWVWSQRCSSGGFDSPPSDCNPTGALSSPRKTFSASLRSMNCTITITRHHKHVRTVPHACWVEATKRILELEATRWSLATITWWLDITKDQRTDKASVRPRNWTAPHPQRTMRSSNWCKWRPASLFEARSHCDDSGHRWAFLAYRRCQCGDLRYANGSATRTSSATGCWIEAQGSRSPAKTALRGIWRPTLGPSMERLCKKTGIVW